MHVDLRNADGAPLGNPRAVWVSLDELTEPSPQETDFFLQLGSGIIEIGRQAGMPVERIPSLQEQFGREARTYAESIFEGSVREFVKFAAAAVAREVKCRV